MTPSVSSEPRQRQAARLSSWVGRSLLTKEATRHLKGGGTFVDDVRLPGLLYASMLRSPYGHARIRSVRAEGALSQPGVAAVLTADDVVRMSDPLPQMTVPPAASVRDYPIAVRKVRYVGEPVAIVVADSAYHAEDALDFIEVEYEPLPAVLDGRAALGPDAPLLHEEVGSNVMAHVRYRWGDVDEAFRRADHIVTTSYHFHRFSSAPLEANAVVASWDATKQHLTVWCNNQEPSFMLPQFNSALRLNYDQMRFITQDIGGGFGCKIINYAHIILISLASMKLHRPVKWTETRTEHLMGASHGAERIFDVQAAITDDGRILGLRLRTIDDNGAYARHEPAGLTVWAQVVPGCYQIKHVEADMYAVFTNKCPAGPNRGFARAPHLFMLERLVDRIARTLTLDPAEVRLRNFIRPEEMPYTTLNGCTYDGGDYPHSLRIVLEAVDYDDWRRRQPKLRSQGRLIGIGVATTLDSGAPNFGQVRMLNPRLPLIGNSEAAMLQLTPDGRFIVRLGTVPQGQHHETAVAQIIAEVFRVEPSLVSVASGFDSASHPYTMHSGTYGSRFAAMGGGAVYGAALKLRDKVLAVAAHVLQTTQDKLQFENGEVRIRETPDKTITMKRLARIAYGMPALLPPDMEPGFWTYHVYRPPFHAPDERNVANLALTYSYQSHAVIVEIDRETGKIQILRHVIADDAGRMINPLIVEGQVHGAAAHGVGAALFEEYVYTPAGLLATSTFLDYLAPTAVEMPHFDVHHLEIPSSSAPLGAKGVGEGGGAAHVAIINAVEDALAFRPQPLQQSIVRPETVYRLLRASS